MHPGIERFNIWYGKLKKYLHFSTEKEKLIDVGGPQLTIREETRVNL
jgi:hypothetical protein